MATSFSSLPIIDLAPLANADFPLEPTPEILLLASQLHNVFATSGFAYLTNPPLSFNHDDVFNLSKHVFSLPVEEKMKMAKQTFVKENGNTYRGYFPIQPLKALDNLKEGFEIGSGKSRTRSIPGKSDSVFNMYEPNVWPSPQSGFPAQARRDLTKLYSELQGLSAKLLSLVAMSLNKPADHFSSWLDDSLSTLRLLHYPTVTTPTTNANDDDDAASISSTTPSLSATSIASTSDISCTSSIFSSPDEQQPTTPHHHPTTPPPLKLSCTPHTDSGILTLLHQDPTGGLEVLNSAGAWIPAPYVPDSIVVNIGDLMAKVSGGRFVATMHRVRSPQITITKGGMRDDNNDGGFGRFSMPFFFEPGEECLVRTIRDGSDSDDDGGGGEGVRYGDHVREKMAGWVEFQGDEDTRTRVEGALVLSQERGDRGLRIIT